MRDDFDSSTKLTLAKRVGFRCSNPSCRKPTSGPQSVPTKAINIGVAAHITAASQGGPRYDRNLSSSKRKSIENGIWLCQSCAKLVDSDPERYTVEVLLQWKRTAERMALLEVESTYPDRRDTNDPLDNLTVLLDSPENWVKVKGDEYIRHRYNPEFVIKRDGDAPDIEFNEPWVKGFPDKKARKIYVEYWYGVTLLRRSPFVIVDGGRYIIPLPQIHNSFPEKDEWEYIQLSINASSIEWKTAKLFEQYLPLEIMLPKVGVVIK
jgi:hypothetical protein